MQLVFKGALQMSRFTYFYFTLTLLVGWQEGHPTHKNLCNLSQRLSSWTCGGRRIKPG